jgi:glycosyltransferase involved in cell wall biosynthesis
MRILHVVRRLDASWGGAPAAAAHMASALAAEGHDITVATTVARESDHGETAQLAAILDPASHVVAFARSALPYDHSPRLNRWLKSHVASFDLVEVHGVFDYPCWAGAEQSRRQGRPFVVHPHGSLDPFDLRKHHQLKKVVGATVIRRVLNSAAAVVVTTKREGTLLTTFGARPRIRAIPLPYRPGHHDGDARRFRDTYDVPTGPIVLFLGRVDYKKGLQHLVDAAGRLAEHREITFVIGGGANSPFADRIRGQVTAQGLDKVVRFVGHLGEADKADALAAATLFSLISDNENYGLVLVEAARAGLPMLISDQVYLEEELTAGGGAVVVARDGAAVAKVIDELFDDEQQLAEMAAAARRTADKLFDWDSVARDHSEFRIGLTA